MTLAPHLVGTPPDSPRRERLPVWAIVSLCIGSGSLSGFGGSALFNWRVSQVETGLDKIPATIAAATAAAIGASEKSVSALRDEQRDKNQQFDRRIIDVEHGQSTLEHELFTKVAEVLAVVRLSDEKAAKTAVDVAFIRGKLKEQAP